MEKVKKYKILYQICLVVGVLGLVDIATHSIVQQNYGLTDAGYLSVGALFVFNFLFGTKVASILVVFVSTIFGLSIVWLMAAYLLNKKMQIIESPTEENKKKFKRAKIVTGVVIGVIILVSMLAIIPFASSLI